MCLLIAAYFGRIQGLCMDKYVRPFVANMLHLHMNDVLPDA
jgi:hypothetical protein